MQPSVREIKKRPDGFKGKRIHHNKSSRLLFHVNYKNTEENENSGYCDRRQASFFLRDFGTWVLVKERWKHIQSDTMTSQKTPAHKNTINLGTAGKASEVLVVFCSVSEFPLCPLSLHLSSLCVYSGPAPVCSCWWYLLISADAVTTN